MSIHDDACDFCGAFVDPIGGETAKVLSGERLWDGVCDAGILALYGGLSDDAVVRAINKAELRLVTDPISDSDPIGERAQKLGIQDLVCALRRLLEIRADNAAS